MYAQRRKADIDHTEQWEAGSLVDRSSTRGGEMQKTCHVEGHLFRFGIIYLQQEESAKSTDNPN